jgi:hypothetical protein
LFLPKVFAYFSGIKMQKKRISAAFKAAEMMMIISLPESKYEFSS